MFEIEIEELSKKGLLRQLKLVQSPSERRILLEGRMFLNLSSNNYLGLSNHPALKEAAINAINQYGIGTGASALISGHTALHAQLAEKVAEFKGTEAALIFNTGYMANTGVFSALLNPNDFIYADRLCHASIIDGCRLSKATFRVFPHRDIEALSQRLKRHTPKGHTLLVTDGVFSMDGDLAPLPELAALAKQHGALLMVDDAHGTGVMGTNGRGILEHFGMKKDEVTIQMGTFSKALGGFGAYICGGQTLIDYLSNRARSYIYTTAIPAALAAANLTALELIDKEPLIRHQLWENHHYYLQGVQSLGYQTLQSETPIIPLLVGDTFQALQMSQRLWEEGIFAPAIRPPTVPEDTARIRTSVMATHTQDDLDFALEVLGTVGKELGIL